MHRVLVLAVVLVASVARAAVWDVAPLSAFHYQLQNLDVAQAAASPFPLLVTDYSFDGSAAGELTAADVATLQSGGRTVLAYLSIGEAETYRFYWDPAWTDEGPGDPDRPAWLGPANRDFPDNLEVRFWDPAWQAIVFGAPGAYLDRIIAQGFDGVYLDIVDGYEFWDPDGNGERPTAADDMRAFVEAIAAYGRAVNPAFVVVPQNASALVADPTYLAAISGIGAEDTWFDGNRRQRFQPADVVPYLDAVRDAGKSVLAIDYPTRTKPIAEFFDRAEARGYGAYNASRALDVMTIRPAHPPSPGPSVASDAPADGAAASRTTPPTFAWTGTATAGYEMHVSGTSYLEKLKVLPRRGLLSGSSFTPTPTDWARLVRLTRQGDGVTLYWWVVAVDADGARRSGRLRSVGVSLP